MTVSCASPARDGPRSVELASSDANGPVITAELVGAQPALRADAPISADAASERRQTAPHSVMILIKGLVPTTLTGLGGRGGGATTGGVNWFGACGSIRGAFSVGETGAAGDVVVVVVVVVVGGFGSLFLTRATCGDRSHRNDGAESGNGREATRQTTLCPHYGVPSIYLHWQMAGSTVDLGTDSESAPDP